MADERTTYEQLVEHNPKIREILDPEVYKFVQESNVRTVSALDDIWKKYARRNLKKYFKQYGLLVDNCRGFGFQKAVVMIGAGPSLKNNWEFLKKLTTWNWKFSFESQPFIFVTCNHQFKKCLKEGVVPHFVVLVDAGQTDAIYDQLCTDIPPKGDLVTLIAAIHCRPKIIKDWTKQGRLVQFYIPSDDENTQLVKDVTGKDIGGKGMLQGGNVSNVAWMMSLTALDSRIFMSLGNDLSYEISDDIDKRRAGYYDDGDYSTNLASGRDEAKGMKHWLGFEMRKSPLTDEAVIDWKLRGTTHSLFTYKNWVETYVAIQDVTPSTFHYYNCSEAGILGMVAKSYKKVDLDDPSKWTILDEILPRRWHTRLFEDAVSEYLSTREVCLTQMGIKTGVGAVEESRLPMAGVKHTDQNLIVT